MDTTPILTPPPPPATLRVALVRRAHGVHGEVRAEPLGGDAARFAAGVRLRREDDGTPLTVASARRVADGDVLISFTEVHDRDQADRLRGAYLCVPRAEARPLPEQEWFVHELVGLRAVSATGAELGVVRDVEAYVGNDVLVVGGDSGERRYPLAHAFVERIDREAGVVVLTPWEEEA